MQILTVQIEALSLETSKFSLYSSGSCIPIPLSSADVSMSFTWRLPYRTAVWKTRRRPYPTKAFVYISPRIFSCFQFDFSVKSIKFSTRNSKYLFIFCNNCRACVELTLEIQRESIRFLQTYAHP
jgi:hypothetical protein